LSDIGLEAAEEALRKVPYAVDRYRQFGEVVTLLHMAEVALRRATLPGPRRDRLEYLSLFKVGNLTYRRRYILGLMAICYRYLGENVLAERALSAIQESDLDYERRNSPEASRTLKSYARSLGTALNVRDWVEIVRRFRLPEEYFYDLASFRSRLDASWEEDPEKLAPFETGEDVRRLLSGHFGE
jgi:hypothetical protein